MRKAIIVLIIIAVAFLGILMLAAIGSSHNSDESHPGDDDVPTKVPAVSYNYTVEKIEYIDGYSKKYPEEGFEFVLIHAVIKNNKVSAGVTTNPYSWSTAIKVNNVTYQHDAWLASYAGNKTVTINEGGTSPMYMVVEVPEGHELNDMTIIFKYNRSIGSIERDTTLIVN